MRFLVRSFCSPKQAIVLPTNAYMLVINALHPKTMLLKYLEPPFLRLASTYQT